MTGYVTELHGETQTNDNFRKVLFTGLHSQLVAMSLLPGEEIGMEVHENDQFIYIVSGRGQGVLDNEQAPLDPGTGIVIPAGTEHNIINTGEEEMKLFTVYSPAEHEDGTVHRTKAEADEAEAAA